MTKEQAIEILIEFAEVNIDDCGNLDCTGCELASEAIKALTNKDMK